MAQLHFLKDKDGNKIYPVGIPQGIVDPINSWNLKDVIDELSVLLGDFNVENGYELEELRTALSDGGDNNVAEFIERINIFLTDSGATAEKIDSWKEIEDFLTGISDTTNLTKLLSDTLDQAKTYVNDTLKVTTSGTGNVITSISKSGANITATKGTVPTTTEFNNLKSTVDTLSGALSGQAVTMPTAATEAGLVLVSAGANRTAKTDIAIDDLVTVDDTADAVNDGLMTSNDYVKLQAIEEGANKYVLPVAGTAIGGVKSGGNITVDASGNVTVNQATKATQDGNGKNIASTYATKDEVATSVSDVVKGASNIGAGTGKLILSNGAGKVAESDYSQDDVFMREDIQQLKVAYGSVSSATGGTYIPDASGEMTVTIPSDTSHLTNNGGYAKTSDVANTYVKKTDVKNLTVKFGSVGSQVNDAIYNPNDSAQTITIPTDTGHLNNNIGGFITCDATNVSDKTDYTEVSI